MIRAIMQVQAGQAVPVTHGERTLRADGTLMGRRLAALIELRDQARRVLRSQHEDWPEAQRHQARRELNRAYDRFVSRYGPINTTTRHTREDGTVVRRLPNLVTFRDDPDAMLVMSLEAYDEDTDTARKADIMQRDVVGRVPPVTEVGSAEDGLLVSLNQRGTCRPALYRLPVSRPRSRRSSTELGDLIYQDPASGDWQTADQYLSGNVRAKLTSRRGRRPDPQRRGAARRCSPRTCCPATSTPISARPGSRTPTSATLPPPCSTPGRRPSPSAISRRTRCGPSPAIGAPRRPCRSRPTTARPGSTASPCWSRR